jgi:hypothetical protein
MRAYAIGFRFKAGLRFCRCVSSQLQPVVMFLNDEGGRQQSLKGFLVKRQVGPVRGHGIWGRRTVQTEAIVVQVWAVLNTKEDGGPFGRDSRLGMPIWKRFMRTV